MTIVASALWRRLDTPGHDTCCLQQGGIGWSLLGTAVFRHESGPASVAYAVHCDPHWETLSGHIHGVVGGRHVDYRISRSTLTWTVNGHAVPGLEHLVDLDLGFTPATNFAQLKRVAAALEQGERVEFPVAWFDLGEDTLVELPQIYQRRGADTLWYDSPTAGYQALLELLPNGFVRRYPELWEAEE
jgi:uncharacterized protein